MARKRERERAVTCRPSGLTVPARKPGLNALLHPETWLAEKGVASGVSGALHGVRSEVAVSVPQVCGVARGARPPPWSFSSVSLNGSCGEFS